MTAPRSHGDHPSLPPAPSGADLRAHPAVRNYMLLSLAALFVLVVCLVDRGLGWWAVLPALIGCVALLALWSIGPPLVLVALIGLILASERYRGYPFWARKTVPTAMDLILCAAVLGYVLGQYRLLSLLRHILPTEPRRSSRASSAAAAHRRSADLVTPGEMMWALLALPWWTGLSVLAWSWLMDDTPALDIPLEIWRTLLIIWVVFVVVVVVVAVGGYTRQNSATAEESLLFLQDQLWRGTRREQGNLNRWFTWARLRWQRRRKLS